MICSHCLAWMTPTVDKAAGRLTCSQCGHTEARPFPPLFVVTGPSGTGKTTVVAPLQALLPDWEVFETDILWDSGGDTTMAKGNWVRIADSLAQRPHPRLTILCGTIQPAELVDAGAGWRFGAIHFLALTCEETLLLDRLEKRPAWRGCDAPFNQKQLEYQRWLHANRESAFDPPLTLLDTSEAPIEETARRIRDWARVRQGVR